jgi:hypothetical protein
MQLRILSGDHYSYHLEYSCGNKKKAVWEKWSDLPGKLRSMGENEVVEISKERIKERLQVTDISPVFEQGVESATHPHYDLYKRFIASIVYCIDHV